jgi:hypothetical protein
VSHDPIQRPTSPPRRAPPQGRPGARRPLRERLAHPHIRPPELTPPRKKALAWTGGILALIAIAIAVLIAFWDWNWFRGPLARVASERLHRQVAIAGDLNVNLWSWQPSATVDGISIANPAWAGKERLGGIDRFAVRIRLVPLLRGRLDIRQVRVSRPDFSLLADAKGRKNWDFSDGRDAGPASFPPIHNFIIEDGHVRYLDTKRDIRFQGVLNAHERYWEHRAGFELNGQGTINGAPFRAEVTGGPLLNIDRSTPYPFNADIHAGRTAVTAHGQVPKPFDLGRFTVALTARGPDMAQLFPLTGLAFPNSPPYNLKGTLLRNGNLWTIDDLAGRVGASDLAGDLAVTTGRVRPFLKANLSSRSLDFTDLGALFGGRPTHVAPGAPPPEPPRAGQTHFFPDATLDFKRIHAMDADVTYKAASIHDAPVSLRAASARVRLDDGLLRADPLSMDLPQGRVAGHVSLNARKATPVTDLDLRLSNARIEHLVPVKLAGGPPITGALVGRARLSGAGDSVHKALSRANGQVTVVAPGGEIRQGVAELLGLNVIKGLGLLNKKDTTPVRCAVADFRTQGGVMRADNIVMDTGPVLVKGEGQINLATEQMDLRVRGHDKKFRLLRVLLPIKATGPINAPKLGVETGGAIAQAGVGLSLGAVLSPLAAIFPFVDPGLAKDADCAALIAQANASGAPVKTAPAAHR